MSDTDDPDTLSLFDFDGKTYSRPLDQLRLNAQTARVVDLMRDGAWRTLAEIEKATGDPQASVSARLRDLRKFRFGMSTVERRRRGEGSRGLHEYRLVMSEETRAMWEAGWTDSCAGTPTDIV